MRTSAGFLENRAGILEIWVAHTVGMSQFHEKFAGSRLDAGNCLALVKDSCRGHAGGLQFFHGFSQTRMNTMKHFHRAFFTLFHKSLTPPFSTTT